MYKDTKLIFAYETKTKPNRLIAPLDLDKPDLASFYGEAYSEELPDLPDIDEVSVIRHYTNLSAMNYGVETGTYPLGSCTMKYNPKVNEDLAALDGFTMTHPLQPEETVQGNLELLYSLEQKLCDLIGMDHFTFQPSAGAHGEHTGLLLIKAYHEDRGDTKRNIIIVPDSAHGTNPASAAMVGYQVREVASNEKGRVDLEALKELMSDQVAGLMLTNPNTLGLFETEVEEITKLVHDCGGLVYYDGANANAILMQARPGDMGFDVVHLNVHKTLSTPHGGGGPGAGPVGCKDFLAPYLPKPVVVRRQDGFALDYDRPKSIGKVRAFTGSFGIMVRAYAYILANGAEGLKEVSEGAVANANYVLERVREAYDVASEEAPMHEFVITGARQKKGSGCNTHDIAKRLIDYGFHPPTVYFPLIVPEAMMVEPTETESRADLDALADALLKIAEEAEDKPELLRGAPHQAPISRPDETRAARKPIVKA
ncbi:MAG TPA: aminomethyl-transferring glycine dehydrogenase subunit GcvPB [Clostridiaceae bacterium]|nr:aminomethyl-transferring glycine dehydrogenase subunit GcvPB [Clostridiaceae bacterium]